MTINILSFRKNGSKLQKNSEIKGERIFVFY